MSEIPVPFAALVFDVGGVLVGHDNEFLYCRLAEACPAADAIDAIRRQARDPRYERGELPIAHFHERLRQELGYSRPFPEFVADWCCHFTVDHAMFDLLARLALETRVLLFSNTNREHWDHLLVETAGRLGGFERYLSHEIGAAKPALEAYRLVAARAGIDPARSLFIDDKPGNVNAARAAGFQAHVFTDRATLERRLARDLAPRAASPP